MDDSVKEFHAYQRALAEQGGPTRVLRRTVTHQFLSLAIFVILIVALMASLSLLPRNADGSMKLVYFGPVLAVLAVASALLLRRAEFRRSPFSLSAWAFILMAVVAIPAGALDLIDLHWR
jgi:hypothetical protein